jgi:16S rRNA (guanine(966)-N(2))-methyltransferase RsmD
VRIIAGSAKGHRLKSLEGMNTRPTQDRVKESVFNIIMNYIAESKVLDFFSGTGNLGIEALSRGASHGVLVDKNPVCVKIIKENLIHTKLEDKAKVICEDVNSALKRLKGQKFDLIFLDPPYNKGHIEPTLFGIFENDRLDSDGLVVVERAKKDEIPENQNYQVVREQVYGDTVVSFLKGFNKIGG